VPAIHGILTSVTLQATRPQGEKLDRFFFVPYFVFKDEV